MSSNSSPSPAELEAAPFLDRWFADLDGVDATIAFKVLVGRCTGHPRLKDGATCVTSPLVEIAPDEGWARTHNRVYRLGRPATLEEEAIMRHRKLVFRAWTSTPAAPPAGALLH